MSGPTTHTSGHPHEREYSRTPLIVTWEVTQSCDLACDHCRADARPNRHPDELTTAEGRALIDDIASFGTPGPILVLSGGDPLKRPDLFELIEYALHSGVSTAVTPASTAQLDGATIERFAELGVRRMALSLDGATAARHDDFRGEGGSFDCIVEAAEQANDANLPIQINTTVTAQTVDDLPEIADLVEAMGAVMWEVFFLVPVGRGVELQQLSSRAAKETMEWLYRRQREASFRVITVEAPFYRGVSRNIARDDFGEEGVTVGSTRAGKGFVFVSHTGEIFPSGFLPMSAGTVRDADLVHIYRESSLFEQLRDPDLFDGPCGSCPDRQFCGGSRSRAYATTGNPLGSDPLCPRV